MLRISNKFLEELAPELPLCDERGDCIWCCGNGKYGSGREESSHAKDCPWVEARRLLGDDLKK